MKKDSILDNLLANYRLWGFVAIGSFVLFCSLLAAAVLGNGLSFIVILMVLMSGFLWIGTTSICRHSFILLKKYIGKDVSILEFLSTQLVVFLFPLAYIKVKKEVDVYLEKAFIDGDRK